MGFKSDIEIAQEATPKKITEIAASLGMKVFLLTDNLINRTGEDISCYPHGSFPELLTFIREL